MAGPVESLINTNVVRNYQTAEYSKFVELLDSRFPSVSVIRSSVPDRSNAFPDNTSVPPTTSVDIYPKYGVLSYITNFSDMAVTLSAGDVNIGAVEIKDGNSGAKVDVVSDDGLNALRVLSQDLESDVDDIAIGDREGNLATVNSSFSALRVYPVVHSGGYTKCETRTSGNPSFITSQVLIYNPANSEAFPILTLTSGLSCKLPLGKKSDPGHTLHLPLEVKEVNNYAGCEMTFFA